MPNTPKTEGNPRAKKSLGQHFLTSKTVVTDMVKSGRVKNGDIVLEIGPGKGILTAEILAMGATVIAIEKDDRMIPILSERFEEERRKGHFILIHGDILDEEVWSKLEKNFSLSQVSYTVIANIPYYITGLLFRHFLQQGPQPARIVFLVQKEVARSVCARDKKEGILSLSIKAYGKPSVIRTVDRKLFSPTPKVDSAILSIEGIQKNNFRNRNEEEKYFSVLHAGFSSKRKTLANNLAKITQTKSDAIKLITSLGLSPSVRPEDVPFEKWIALSRSLN